MSTLLSRLGLASVSAVGLALTACGAPLEKQAEALQRVHSCCSAVSELPLSGALGTEVTAKKLDETTPVFGFEEGPSYFLVFELAKNRPSNRINVSTEMTGFPAQNMKIFCPTLTLLDEEKRVIGNAQLQETHFVRATFTANATFSSYAKVPVEARFVAIHSASSAIGTKVSEVVRRTGSNALYAGSVELESATCAQTGQLFLSWSLTP